MAKQQPALKQMPHTARLVRTHQELGDYLSAVVRGIDPFVWVVGRTGIGKSVAIKSALAGQPHCQMTGIVTPLAFYRKAYEHRDEPIHLDDVRGLFDDERGQELLSSITDTQPGPKRMAYTTTSQALGDVPATYYTTSPIIISSNSPPDWISIVSRALTLFFDPPNDELHRWVATWFYDQEIHDWFGEHVCRMRLLEARAAYVMAARDKEAGRDWRRHALEAWSATRERAATIVQDLEDDPHYPSVGAKAHRFVELMAGAKGASHRTYERIRAELRAAGLLERKVIPPMLLLGRPSARANSSRPSSPSPRRQRRGARSNSLPPRRSTATRTGSQP
jgi:hypothetical protein